MIKTKRKSTYIVFIVVGILAILGVTLASTFRTSKTTDVNVYPVTLDANIQLKENLQNVVLGDTIVDGVSFRKNDTSNDVYVRADLRYNATGTLSDEDKSFLIAINYDDVATYEDALYKWVRAEDGYYYLTDINGAPLKITDNTIYTFCGSMTYQGAKCVNNLYSAPSSLYLNAELQAIHAKNMDGVTLDNLSTLFNTHFGMPPTLGYIVAFDTDDGGFIPAQVFLNTGMTATEPAQPNKLGYEFVGWYTDSECTAGNEYDFNTTVSSSFTLYAKFQAPSIEIIQDGEVIKYVQNNNYTLSELILSDKELQNKYNFYNDESLTDSIALDDVLTDEQKIYVETVSSEIRYSKVSNASEYMVGSSSHSSAYPSSVTATEFIIADNYTYQDIVYPVTQISERAFYQKDLTSIKLPSTLILIDRGAFMDCANLTSIAIPENVTSINGNAFVRCYGLTSVYITSLESWLNIEFGDVFATPLYEATNGYLYLNNVLLEDVVVPNTISEVKNYTFYNCDSIITVELPDNIVNIGDRAFSDCGNLTSINIPQNVMSIGSGALSGCISLTAIQYNATSCSDFSYGGFLNNAGIAGAGITLTIGANVVSIPARFAYDPNNVFNASPNIRTIIFEENSLCTTIGYNAFRGCYSIIQIINKGTSLTIEKGSTSNGYIGYYAVEVINGGSESEGTFEMQGNYGIFNYQGLKYLYTARNITSIEINDIPSVDVIQGYVFYGYDKVLSVTIPSSVDTIKNSAFDECIHLVRVINNSTSLNIQQGSTSNGCIGYYAIEIVNAGGSVTGSFEDNDQYWIYLYDNKKYLVGLKDDSITEVTNLPDVDIVHDYAFEHSSITSITLPDTITSIGASAFYYCYSLKNIVMPADLEYIGERAFMGCSGLTSITIPENVLSIGGYAFSDCSRLSEIIYNAVECEDLGQFSNLLWNAGSSVSTMSVTIGKNVKRLPNYLFATTYTSNAGKMTNVEFEAGSVCTEIGSYAFGSCYYLVSVVLPETITSIGYNAFSSCSRAYIFCQTSTQKDLVTSSTSSFNADRVLYKYNGTLSGATWTTVSNTSNMIESSTVGSTTYYRLAGASEYYTA